MRDRGKTLASLALLVAVVAGLALGAVGGVSAADVEIANETVSVDDDTRSVYAEINATNNSGPADVTVEFIPVEGDENDTVTREVTVDEGETTLEEFEGVNATAYDSYRVTVTADNSTNTTATTGKLQDVQGGAGGGGIGGTGIGAGAAVALLAVAGLLLRSGD